MFSSFPSISEKMVDSITHRRASYRKIKQQTANQGKTEILELFNEIGLN